MAAALLSWRPECRGMQGVRAQGVSVRGVNGIGAGRRCTATQDGKGHTGAGRHSPVDELVCSGSPPRILLQAVQHQLAQLLWALLGHPAQEKWRSSERVVGKTVAEWAREASRGGTETARQDPRRAVKTVAGPVAAAGGAAGGAAAPPHSLDVSQLAADGRLPCCNLPENYACGWGRGGARGGKGIRGQPAAQRGRQAQGAGFRHKGAG